jgi:hypothetical protein
LRFGPWVGAVVVGCGGGWIQGLAGAVGIFGGLDVYGVVGHCYSQVLLLASQLRVNVLPGSRCVVGAG